MFLVSFGPRDSCKIPPICSNTLVRTGGFKAFWFYCKTFAQQFLYVMPTSSFFQLNATLSLTPTGQIEYQIRPLVSVVQ